MLVLSRMLSEKIKIGEDVYLTVLSICGNQVLLGFEAERHIRIYREEVLSREAVASKSVRCS